MNIELMARRYRDYCEWAQRSGYVALDWTEYKAQRAHLYAERTCGPAKIVSQT